MAKQMYEKNLAEQVKLIKLLTCLDWDFVFVSDVEPVSALNKKKKKKKKGNCDSQCGLFLWILS